MLQCQKKKKKKKTIDTKGCEITRIKHTTTAGTRTENEGRKNNGKQCQQLISNKKTVCMMEPCEQENVSVSSLFFLFHIKKIRLSFEELTRQFCKTFSRTSAAAWTATMARQRQQIKKGRKGEPQKQQPLQSHTCKNCSLSELSDFALIPERQEINTQQKDKYENLMLGTPWEVWSLNWTKTWLNEKEKKKGW